MFCLNFLNIGLLLWVLMTLLWLVSLRLHDASIVDSFWGLGFVIVSWSAFILAPLQFTPRQVLVNLLVTIWGLRLGVHIFRRNYGRGEDYRYQQWRAQYGSSWWWRSYLHVFMLQGFLLWLVSMPLVAVQFSDRQSLTGWDAAAVLIWLVGFGFEAIGDGQLARFRRNPANRGQVLQTGLWRYTRHPNYFGDALQWWGFYLLAALSGAWWTIFSPVLMTWLLVRVSGVTLLERRLSSRPGYDTYIRRTSSFLPRPPKRDHDGE